MKAKLVFISILMFILFSCNDEQEIIPSYLYIPRNNFDPGNLKLSKQQNFQDAWIYVNDTYVGAYQLPVRVPVLAQGKADVRVFAGIRPNGMITHARPYPLVNVFNTTIDLQPTIIDTLVPVYGYVPELKIGATESFETTHFFTSDKDGDLETKMVLTPSSESFEGLNSGVLTLDTTHRYYESWHDADFNLPKTINTVFLEFHYKSDIPFFIGLVALNSGDVPLPLISAQMNPKSNWTKAYFDFSDITNTSGRSNYKLAIRTAYVDTSAIKSQKIFIDNIQVLYL
ncbi:MAG TPA: hypothetical protein PK006_11905 [Saprospiraceae bacterium]|nr:hypothetical protein [Saprospiraceae bacterium]